MKKKHSLLLLPLLLCSCGKASEWTMEQFYKEDGVNIKNVILMISDGTSANTVNIARDVNGGHLYIDEFMNGSVVTASLTTLSYDKKLQNDNPTDSAAAATAMATGHKTTNKSIGLVDGIAKETVLEKAQEKGMKTGLVTTVGLVDATPAAFYAHTEERSELNDIYQALVNSNVDVLIGDVDINNKEYFNAEDFENKGYTVVFENKAAFDAIDNTTTKLMANFDERYDWRVGNNYPHLVDYTTKALELLENENGFFAMIEGGAIDHANHNWMAYESITDFLAFDKAVHEVMEFAKNRNDTAVIVCPDHGNGAIKYIKGANKYNEGDDLGQFLMENTEYQIQGHTNEDVYLASYIPEGVARIGGNNQFIDNTTIAYYIDALLDLGLFA